MASLEAQLSQSQQTVADLQLQVSSLEGERQQLEQALQGAHAEMQTLRDGSVGYGKAVCGRIASRDADTVTTTSLDFNVLCNVLCCL